ncbi:Hint domain-containing protein [Roseivivax lentus]|uniref:Hint domain-containing protein n=1 Tax=Roseivivax lentus TaxID=633194 RepID=A0A1N7JV93_9RHOB|nr:Hint domain-containing protein [Roseivivax lentus]SIS53259.1 Hint domain-containing protein [Roseivivax lentus]
MAQIVVTESGTVEVSNGDTVIIDIPGGGDVTLVAAPGSDVQTFRIEFVDDGQSDSVAIDLSTFSGDGLHIDIKDYDPSDQISLLGAFDTFVEPNNVDEYQFSYTGDDGVTYTGYVRAKDKDERDFTQDPAPIIICFAGETELKTTLGWKRADQIKPWDCLETADAGFQPVRWVGRKRLSAQDLASHPDQRPVIVEKGALGPNMPRRRLRLSPQHRVLMRGARLEMLFGLDEAFVPVKALVNGRTIYPDASGEAVEYVHVLLDEHAVLNAQGCPAESLLMADRSRAALRDGANAWDRAMAEDAAFGTLSMKPARPLLKVSEGRLLVEAEEAARPASWSMALAS